VEFVDEFPMTATGKIQKFVMREAVEQRLGLKAATTA
jgi:fatty-acyl-CoA synthase